LAFTDMLVPQADLLGEPNQGFSYLTSNLAQERLSIAVNSQAAASATLQWALEDEKLAGQHVKFELAACAAEIAAGQALIDAAITDLLTGSLGPADAAVAKL